VVQNLAAKSYCSLIVKLSKILVSLRRYLPQKPGFSVREQIESQMLQAIAAEFGRRGTKPGSLLGSAVSG
jgi:hypothetical protein